MKRISILGSTGSIGRNALAIVSRLPDHFSVKALAAGSNIDLLAEQIDRYRPDIVSVLNAELASRLKASLSTCCDIPEIVWGQEGCARIAAHDAVDMVVSAIVGAAGLIPTLAAIDAGKEIALANKEILVMAGDIVMKRAGEKRVNILPIDSEHSAVFQCIAGHRREDVDKIFLTASGGPFLDMPAADFRSIRPEDALNHPTWRMGAKISVDCATLMNKGLEVVEATHLFGISHDAVEILIHRQSVVHSMVSFRDGSVLAQLGIPDMRGAIAYAMSYPRRYSIDQPLPDFPRIGTLTFEHPDFEKFPCLTLAYNAAKAGGTLPAVLNAANEEAVKSFLDHRIGFNDIPEIIRQVMARHETIQYPGLTDILDADRQARKDAKEKIRQLSHD